MRQTRTFTKRDGSYEHSSSAYTDDGKVWLWSSVDRPCPIDSCREYGIPCDFAAQQAAIEKYTDEVLSRYRESRRNYVPSDEEAFEMRAAFGPGADVVDVFTGQRFRT